MNLPTIELACCTPIDMDMKLPFTGRHGLPPVRTGRTAVVVQFAPGYRAFDVAAANPQIVVQIQAAVARHDNKWRPLHRYLMHD